MHWTYALMAEAEERRRGEGRLESLLPSVITVRVDQKHLSHCVEEREHRTCERCNGCDSPGMGEGKGSKAVAPAVSRRQRCGRGEEPLANRATSQWYVRESCSVGCTRLRPRCSQATFKHSAGKSGGECWGLYLGSRT
jgi:hypothetical protein